MLVEDAIARLKATCPLLRGRVYGSIELATAKPTAQQMPCAFVVPMSEKAEGNALLGGFSQRVTAQIGVVIAIQNFQDARGQAGHAILEPVRSEIRAALCGWNAPDTATQVEFVAGQLAAYDNLTMRWNDIYTTDYYFRK